MRSLGLYVHLPWCVRKCPYCDFNSFAQRGVVPQGDYVVALLRDLEFERPGIGTDAIASVYIGGGTPSLFSADEIGRLLTGIRDRVNVTPGAEITLEANPGTLEAARLRAYREVGVNRVSIGVQSLRDDQLARLGRVHCAQDARNAVTAALSAGFDSVNLDLMYGLPGDGMAEGLADLDEAIALGTPHLSWYQLTLEPNTAWKRRPPPGIPEDDVLEPFEEAALERIAAAGFERYEVSAFARPGHQCAHNRNYWRFGDYVGIGAGAHSKQQIGETGEYQRYSKRRNPQSFMKSAGSAACTAHRDTVSEPRAIALEYLMNALRLLEGVSIAEFEATTGLDASSFEDGFAQARRQGLLTPDKHRLQPTLTGLRQLNRVLRLV